MAARSTARSPRTEAIEAARQGRRISVQLDKDVAERVITWAERERRSISFALNELAKRALDAEEAGH